MAKSTCCYCRGPWFGSQLTTGCNSSFGRDNTFFWRPRVPHMHVIHRHTCKHFAFRELITTGIYSTALHTYERSDTRLQVWVPSAPSPPRRQRFLSATLALVYSDKASPKQKGSIFRGKALLCVHIGKTNPDSPKHSSVWISPSPALPPPQLHHRLTGSHLLSGEPSLSSLSLFSRSSS